MSKELKRTIQNYLFSKQAYKYSSIIWHEKLTELKNAVNRTEVQYEKYPYLQSSISVPP